MDFDREMELENAGIDAFEFSLMDEDERREALEDAFLDPDDYDLIEYDTSFNAWSNLQNAGLSLSELEYMDEDEKRETLKDAGLDPDDYEVYPSYTPSYTNYSAPKPVNTDKYIPPFFPKIVPVKPKATTEPAITTEPLIKTESPAKTDEGRHSETPKEESAPKTETKAENKAPRKVYRFCGVRFETDDRVWYYRTGKLLPKSGDYVEVTIGTSRDVRNAKVISVGDYAEEVVPVPVEGAQYILRVLNETENPSKRTTTQENNDIPPVKETPDEQKKIRRVYDRVKKEKTQNLFMVYVSLFLILLAGVLSFFLWRNNTHGDYDTILIVMGIAGAVFLVILFRALSTERKLARKISAAERRYTWLSDSPGPGLKGYDRLSGSNDSLTKVIIAVFVILIAIAVLTAGIKEDNRRKEEAEALQRAEEMYQLGLEQFSDGKYSAASKSFGIAKEKNIGESQAYWYYSVGMDYAASNSYYSARDRIKSGSNCATTSETKQVGKKLLAQIEKDEQKYNEQLKKQREEEERQYLQSLAKSLPYVGMSEQYINDTALGKPSSTVRHNREMINGQSLVANLYDYTRNGYVIFTARCINGEVYQVFDHRSDPYKQSSGSSSSSSSKKSSSSTKKSDLFHASDYAHPDDFYYDNYDDFWDYEDAEDYWEAHH